MGSVKSNAVIIFVISFLITGHSFAAVSEFPWREEDKRAGYVDEVKPDKTEIAVPLYIVDNPEAGVPTLREKIFNETLTKEFSRKYEEKFGKTEAEVFYTHNSISDMYIYQGHEYTQQQYFDEQKAFSMYMIRRIGEYHFDKGAKNNPVTNSIYTIKEKVRNMDFALSPDFKFVAQYNISGNDLRVEAINPWLISKVTFQMDPAQFAPTAVQTTMVDIGRKFDQNYQVDVYYTIERQMIQVITRRRLTDEASVSLMASPNYYREASNTLTGQRNIDAGTRETLLLGGLTWIF